MVRRLAPLVGMTAALSAACSGGTAGSTGSTEPPLATASGPPAASSAVDAAGGDSGIDAASAAAGRPAVYPVGPYGLTEASTLPPSLAWQGYVGGSSQATTISIADYFDADGSRGINALEIDIGAAYCTQCRAEAPVLEALLEGDGGKEGIRALTLLLNDATFHPATVETAAAWVQSFDLHETDVAANPVSTFPIDDIPTSIVVDPRTMTVVLFMIGYDAAALSTLAARNAQPP
jgi:hypothetical protein